VRFAELIFSSALEWEYRVSCFDRVALLLPFCLSSACGRCRWTSPTTRSESGTAGAPEPKSVLSRHGRRALQQIAVRVPDSFKSCQIHCRQNHEELQDSELQFSFSLKTERARDVMKGVVGRGDVSERVWRGVGEELQPELVGGCACDSWMSEQCDRERQGALGRCNTWRFGRTPTPHRHFQVG